MDSRMVPENAVETSIRLVDQANGKGIPLRIIAGCAVMVHCPRYRKTLQEKMGRKPMDVDLVSSSEQKGSVKKLMASLGFRLVPCLREMKNRDEYLNSENLLTEIFYDKMEMCHDIDLRERLQIDMPTIPLADLLLQKTQIVTINEKDIKDVLILLLEHEVGCGDNETINVDYVAKILSDDWGFYYTLTRNMRLAQTFLQKYVEALSSDEQNEINGKILNILSRIEREPKSMRWRMRQRIGTKKIWYREVEEKEAETPLTEYFKAKDSEQPQQD